MKNIILYIIMLILAFVFVSIAIVSGKGPFSVDIIVNSWGQGIWTEFGKSVFLVIAWLGDVWGVIILGFIALSFFLYKKAFKKAIVLVVTMGLTVGTSTLVKFLVARERPENMIMDYHGYSFPSGHSTMAILFYGLLFYLISNYIKNKFYKLLVGSIFILMGILVIFSRIYLSVHWFSDVVGGVILGIFWLIFGVVFYGKVRGN